MHMSRIRGENVSQKVSLSVRPENEQIHLPGHSQQGAPIGTGPVEADWSRQELLGPVFIPPAAPRSSGTADLGSLSSTQVDSPPSQTVSGWSLTSTSDTSPPPEDACTHHHKHSSPLPPPVGINPLVASLADVDSNRFTQEHTKTQLSFARVNFSTRIRFFSNKNPNIPEDL